MNKPSLGKTLLTTSLAAVLLVGGGTALLRSNAYADTAATSGTATSDTQAAAGNSAKHHKFGEHRMEAGKMMKEVATLLGTDEKTLMQELRGGKTLAQIAQEKQGWDEAALVQKLVDAASAKLDEQVKNGKITQEQADKAKASLPDRVKKAVEGQLPPKGKDQRRGLKHGAKGHDAKGGFDVPEKLQDLAAFLNLSEADLKAKLKDGQSLAAIAQAQNISEDQLIAHIKDGMTDKIKGFVEKVHKAKPAPAASGDAAASSTPAAQQ